MLEELFNIFDDGRQYRLTLSDGSTVDGYLQGASEEAPGRWMLDFPPDYRRIIKGIPQHRFLYGDTVVSVEAV